MCSCQRVAAKREGSSSRAARGGSRVTSRVEGGALNSRRHRSRAACELDARPQEIRKAPGKFLYYAVLPRRFGGVMTLTVTLDDKAKIVVGGLQPIKIRLLTSLIIYFAILYLFL